MRTGESGFRVGAVTLWLALATFAIAQADDKEAADSCNVVHVPIIKDVSVKYDGTKSITITALGEVPTGGYRNTQLVRRIYVAPPADGLWEYDMLTCKPSGIVTQAVTPVKDDDKWDSPPRSLKLIRVYGSKEHKDVEIKWP